MINAKFKSKKLRLIASIMLITIILFLIINGIRNKRAVNNYRNGIEFLRRGEYEEAIKKLQKSVDFWPRGWWFDDAQKKLFYCKLNLGENIENILSIKTIGKEENEVAKSIILMISFIIFVGIIIFVRTKKQKKYQQFISYIKNVEKGIKENMLPTGLDSSVDGFSSVRDYEAYINYYKEGGFVKLAECLISEYYLKGAPDRMEYINKTINTYTKLLSEYPKLVFADDIQYKLANLYFFRVNNYEEAIRAYQNIIEKYSDSKWIKIASSRVNMIVNNSDYGRQPLSIYITAEKYYENKQYEKALDGFRNIVSKFPNSRLADDALYAIGDMYMYKINNLVAAVSEYQQILKKYPQSRYAPNAQYKIGECYVKLKKFSDAIGEYKKFIDNYPNCDFLDYAYYYIGQCYEQEKKFSQAKKFYQKILDDYASSIWVIVAKSRLDVLKDMTE